MSEFPTFPGARELSPDEAEARVQECFEIEQRVKNGLAAGRAALWQLAEALYEFDEERGWSALGYEELVDWLADPEISTKSATYYQLVQTWRELAVMRKVDSKRLENLDRSKVGIVLRSITSGKVSLEDALADAGTLGARDLREKYVRKDRVVSDPPAAEPVDGVDGNQEEDPVIDAEVVPADEVVEVEIGHPATPQPDSLRQFDKTELLEEWLDFRYTALEAVANGETNPRLSARLIARGVSANDQILKAGGLDIGSRDV